VAFFLVCFIAMFFGRKVGWALCRSLLYTSPWIVCGAVCLGWAVGIAYGLRLLIVNMHPGWLLMIVAFVVAAYISIPNYGLLNESTVPDDGTTTSRVHQERAAVRFCRAFHRLRIHHSKGCHGRETTARFKSVAAYLLQQSQLFAALSLASIPIAYI